MEWKPDVCWDATFSIEDTAGSSARNVAIQLKDYAGNNMTVCSCIYAYISDNSDGSTLSSSADGVAIQGGGGNGLLGSITTNENFMLTSEADGTIDVDITEGTDDFYLVLVMPNGKLVISDEIVFT